MILHVSDKQWTIIKTILSQYPYSFYAFGSRVKGTHKQYSDLDLCYMDDIPLHVISFIKEQFEESDLPFTVDLVNYGDCDSDFKQLIKAEMKPLDLTE